MSGDLKSTGKSGSQLRAMFAACAMAAGVIARRSLGSKQLDYALPWVAALSPEAQAEEGKKREDETQLAISRMAGMKQRELEQCLEAFEALATAEEDRRKAVEARLSSIVGLASIAATLATALIVAQAAGTVSFAGPWSRTLMSALGLYLVVQLCVAIGWAIEGQSRKNCRADLASDVVRDPSMIQIDWLRARLATKARQLATNRVVIDHKVSAMAAAHRATFNFIGGLIAISVVGCIVALARLPPESALISALRSNAQLQAMLRGPRGSPGPQGEPGTAGPAGPPGKDSAPRALTCLHDSGNTKQ